MTEEEIPELKLSVGLTQKVSTAPYETADATIFVSGITLHSTDEEIGALVERGKTAYALMGKRLGAMVAEIRNSRGDTSPPPVPLETRAQEPQRQQSPAQHFSPLCVECQGDCWDNRKDKKNPKAPDFKCKDKSCGWAAWVQKDGALKWSAPL